ncbi:MAG: hypothetical protein JWO05_350 [Gemmatimonadetes bacterium]|nr:hypothetical protein [Gemmatimonadota bacterium]
MTLQRMSSLKGHDVAEGDHDVRGWTLVGADGVAAGSVVDLLVDTAAMTARYLDVMLGVPGTADTNGEHVLVPVAAVDLDPRMDAVRVPMLRAAGLWELPRREGEVPSEAEERAVAAAFARR